jgi:3-mercaptopyruvate sulfurtransferase SseA
MGKLTEICCNWPRNVRANSAALRRRPDAAKEAYEVWQLAPGAKLVDVRTRAEWDWVGRIPGAIEIEWMSYPDNSPNPISWPS